MAKVFVVVIDGCRIDALERAHTPNIDILAGEGIQAEAESLKPPLTLPVHFSIFTSLTPLNHGILTNAANPTPSPEAVSLFDLAKMHGLTTAAFYNWEHLRNLSNPGMLDLSVCLPGSRQENSDDHLTELALELVSETIPDLVFLYLGMLDLAGHDFGWMSPRYLEALEEADRQIGRIVDSVGSWGPDGDYNLILLSDHGGDGNSHEEPHPRIMAVPWIAKGPDLVTGTVLERRISLLDTAPTVGRLLGLPRLPQWQGHPVKEIIR
jgi:predicted AlkP superfamily pyrophosphatase or phosphodiesterase